MSLVLERLLGFLEWTRYFLQNLVECFVAVFNKRVRVKRNLRTWIQRNCACVTPHHSDPWTNRSLVSPTVSSDPWTNGSLIRLVGQSLDPDPGIESHWPDPDLHIGQSSILRRLHIAPVFTKTEIIENKFTSGQIEEKLIEYLTRVRLKIEENRTLYSLYEREKKDLFHQSYDNLSELEISLDFKTANSTMDTQRDERSETLTPAATQRDANSGKPPDTEPVSINNRRSRDFIARGMGLMYGRVDVKNTFYIYCKDLATELNNIIIEINNESCYNFVNISNQLVDTELFHERNVNNDVVIQYRSNNEYVKVTYVCRKKGKYEIRITYYGYNIPGSPFLLNIEDNPIIADKNIKPVSIEGSLDQTANTTEDGQNEWIDLPGKRKRSIKRKMSTLPSLFRLKSQRIYSEYEETLEANKEPPSENYDREFNKTDVSYDRNTPTPTEDVKGEQRIYQRKNFKHERTVSKFYEYDSMDSSAIEQSEDILKNININPILTLFDSFDIHHSHRRGRNRGRNLTYSNSNMKRYKKLIINNQELFQIVTKLDYVIKTLNTTELLDILSDLRKKMNLIEKYDQDLEALRKKNVQNKKEFKGDDIYLINEYFTLMYAKLSKKYDSIAQLITENMEEIDFELQKEEENNLLGNNTTDGNSENVKEKLVPTAVHSDNGHDSEGNEKIQGYDDKSVTENPVTVTPTYSDNSRAKRAREKFQQRGNSKKRGDMISNETSVHLRESKSMNFSFTDIKMTDDYATSLEDQTNDTVIAAVPEITKQQNFQANLPNSLTISLEFSGDESNLNSQHDKLDPHIPDTQIHLNSTYLEHEVKNNTNKTDTEEEACDIDFDMQDGNEILNAVEMPNEQNIDENESKQESSASLDIKGNLNNTIRLQSNQSDKGKMPDVERKENGKDNYCVEREKFYEEEKVEQRQTNLHIKETNFHCIANLNKNNLKIYDNQDENERKEDYFRIHAPNPEDNIECNSDLNNLQITNTSDLNNSPHRETKDEIIIEENQEQTNGREMGVEKNIKNLEQRVPDINKWSCSAEENKNEDSLNDENYSSNLQPDNTETKPSLPKPTNVLENNNDNFLNIKISNTDLFTGKVLTVNCPKENIGNTIQMKIELCKCSCLETISTISTQTESLMKDEEPKKDDETKSEENQINEETTTEKEPIHEELEEKYSTVKDGEEVKECLIFDNPVQEQIQPIEQEQSSSLKVNKSNQVKEDAPEQKDSKIGNEVKKYESQTDQDVLENKRTKVTPIINNESIAGNSVKDIKLKLTKSNETRTNAREEIPSRCKSPKIFKQVHAFLDQGFEGTTEGSKSTTSLNEAEIPRGLVNQLIGKYQVPAVKLLHQSKAITQLGVKKDVEGKFACSGDETKLLSK
ncbi:hypothetical protein M8J77_010418 [Diaphorina citri]|nr:hypothetical protein M8J77_010418 [Diaphorina citri]